MRIDKWLSAVNIIKRRTVSLDMVKSGVVYLNGDKVKASRSVKIGDKILIKYLKNSKEYEVLQIPFLKAIPKKDNDKYSREI